MRMLLSTGKEKYSSSVVSFHRNNDILIIFDLIH